MREEEAKTTDINPDRDSDYKQRGKKPYNRGSRGRGKPSGGKDKPTDKLSDRRGRNDIDWYLGDNPELVASATQLSFNNPLGTPIPFVSASTAQNSYSEQVPGIITLNMMPLPGVSDSATSSLNIASRRIFSYLRSTLSSNLAGIEAPDVMLYLVAMDSVYSFYAYAMRVYGVMSAYSAINRYYGKAFMSAMGLDYDNFLLHMADFRFYLETFRLKVNRSLKVPGDYGMMKRHYWLYSNVFQDSPVIKSQVYMHVPAGFYMYDSANAWCDMARVPWTRRGGQDYANYEHLIGYGNALLDALLEDDDINTISGIILRAYGDVGVFTLPVTELNYTVFPVYSEEILGQIHNMMIFDAALSDYRTWNIKQVVGSTAQDVYLYVVPAGEPFPTDDASLSYVGASAGDGSLFMDSFVDVPTPQEILINSRNMFTAEYKLDESSYKIPYLKASGLDVCVGAYIWDNVLPPDSYQPTRFSTVMALPDINSYANPDWQDALLAVSKIAKFDWAPRVTLWKKMGTDMPLEFLASSWDFNNTTSFDQFTLYKMHEAALMGALRIPAQASPYSRANNGGKK